MMTREREKSQNGICAMEKIQEMPDRVNDWNKELCMTEKGGKTSVERKRSAM